MPRLSRNQKGLILLFLKMGYSLKRISSFLGFGKTTIYYYYRKIKSRKYKEPIYKINYSRREGEIVGIFTGDGSQYYYKKYGHYHTNVHFGDVLNYVEHVKSLYENYFNKKWRIWRQVTKEGFIAYRLRVIDKKIYFHFFNYIVYDPRSKSDTVRLRTLKLPRSFKIGFIKGLIDTDGWVAKNGAEIGFCTTSEKLAKQVENLFNDLNIDVKLSQNKRPPYKDIFRIRVYKRSIDRFLNLVKPYKALKLRAGNSAR